MSFVVSLYDLLYGSGFEIFDFVLNIFVLLLDII